MQSTSKPINVQSVLKAQIGGGVAHLKARAFMP